MNKMKIAILFHFIPPLKISLSQVKQILSINFSVWHFYDDNVKINNKLSYNKSEFVTHILESNKCVENLKSWTLMDGFLINGYPTMVNGLISQHTFPRRIKGGYGGLSPPGSVKSMVLGPKPALYTPSKEKKLSPSWTNSWIRPWHFFVQGTVRVISSDPPFLKGHIRFTGVPLYSDQRSDLSYIYSACSFNFHLLSLH